MTERHSHGIFDPDQTNRDAYSISQPTRQCPLTGLLFYAFNNESRGLGEMPDEIIPRAGGSPVPGDSGGAPSTPNEERRSLFAILEPHAQQQVIVGAYISSIVLGSALAVLSFHYEFVAQTRHLPFEMRDWMVAMIFALLSLPTLGTIVVAKKK